MPANTPSLKPSTRVALSSARQRNPESPRETTLALEASIELRLCPAECSAARSMWHELAGILAGDPRAAFSQDDPAWIGQTGASRDRREARQPHSSWPLTGGRGHLVRASDNRPGSKSRRPANIKNRRQVQASGDDKTTGMGLKSLAPQANAETFPANWTGSSGSTLQGRSTRCSEKLTRPGPPG